MVVSIVPLPLYSCERMISRRGGIGNVGYKQVLPFSYDSFETLFDVVPLEVRKEILLLESK